MTENEDILKMNFHAFCNTQYKVTHLYYLVNTFTLFQDFVLFPAKWYCPYLTKVLAIEPTS
jgi:hypothetical protein